MRIPVVIRSASTSRTSPGVKCLFNPRNTASSPLSKPIATSAHPAAAIARTSSSRTACGYRMQRQRTPEARSPSPRTPQSAPRNPSASSGNRL